MPDETATRRELGELRRSVNGSLQRLERAMREHQEEHKADARARADATREHREEHQADAKARTAGRRWLAGFLVGLGVLIETPLLYLVAHLH